MKRKDRLFGIVHTKMKNLSSSLCCFSKYVQASLFHTMKSNSDQVLSSFIMTLQIQSICSVSYTILQKVGVVTIFFLKIILCLPKWHLF